MLFVSHLLIGVPASNSIQRYFFTQEKIKFSPHKNVCTNAPVGELLITAKGRNDPGAHHLTNGQTRCGPCTRWHMTEPHRGPRSDPRHDAVNLVSIMPSGRSRHQGHTPSDPVCGKQADPRTQTVDEGPRSAGRGTAHDRAGVGVLLGVIETL